MNLKTIFLINVIVAGIFALASLFGPVFMLAQFGLEAGRITVFMTRFFGVELLMAALLAWYLRNAEFSDILRLVVLAFFLHDIVGVLVALSVQLSGLVNPLGWSVVIIYAFFMVAYGYIYFKKPVSQEQ